jgi:Protein of unknown function (DUF2384)
MAFVTFVDQIRDPRHSYLSPQRASKLLDMQIQEIARDAGVHRNAIARHPDSAALQRYLRDVARVIKAAADAAGGDLLKAVAWFKAEPIEEFDYKTPRELVAERKTDAVISYLISLQGGATG